MLAREILEGLGGRGPLLRFVVEYVNNLRLLLLNVVGTVTVGGGRGATDSLQTDFQLVSD